MEEDPQLINRTTIKVIRIPIITMKIMITITKIHTRHQLKPNNKMTMETMMGADKVNTHHLNSTKNNPM